MFNTVIACLVYLQNQLAHQSILKSFSVNQLKAVEQLLTHLNSNEAKYREIEIQIANHLKELDKLREDTGSNQMKPFFTLAKTIARLKASRKYRPWYQHYSEFFTHDANFWERCIAEAPEYQTELTDLQLRWQQQGRYAVFSTPDLVFAYMSTLRKVNDWFKLAQIELAKKQSDLPSIVWDDYQMQLDTMTQAIAAEKSAMRASLLARLAVGVKKGDLRCDDLVIDTFEQIKTIAPSLGIITKTKLPQNVQQHLSPKVLSYIQAIISLEGTIEEKATLATLLGYSPTNTLITRQDIFGVTFVIPKQVENAVPKKPPFYTQLPEWLHIFFPAKKIAYEFFQDSTCQYLLAAQQALDNLDIKNTTQQNAAWDYLIHLMHLLNEESKRRDIASNKLSSLLHPQTYQLLKDYQGILIHFAKTVFSKQVLIFKKQLAVLEQASHERNLTEREKFQLEEKLEAIQTFKQEWKLKFKIESTWESLKFCCRNLLDKPPLVTEKSDARIQAQTQSEIKNSSNTFNDIDPHTALLAQQYSHVTSHLNQQVSKQNQIALLKTTLHNELTKSPLTLSSPELVEHVQTLKKAVTEIKLLEPRFISSYTLQSTFYAYMEQLFTKIQALPGRATFTPLEGHVQLILKNLKIITTDEILQQMIEQVTTSIETCKTLAWNSWVNTVITPCVTALNQTMELFKGSTHSLAH